MANAARIIKDKTQTTAVTPHLGGVSGTGPRGSEGMTWVSNRPMDQILEKIIDQLDLSKARRIGTDPKRAASLATQASLRCRQHSSNSNGHPSEPVSHRRSLAARTMWPPILLPDVAR